MGVLKEGEGLSKWIARRSFHQKKCTDSGKGYRQKKVKGGNTTLETKTSDVRRRGGKKYLISLGERRRELWLPLRRAGEKKNSYESSNGIWD